MEITVGKQTKYCGGICFDDKSKNNYFVIADFMLGDSDGDKSNLQCSFSKLDKKSKNIILALESIPKDVDNIEFMRDYLEIPYSEYGRWSFQGYGIFYIDKDMKMYECSISFDKEEQWFIDSNNMIS